MLEKLVFGRDGDGAIFARLDGEGPDVPVAEDVAYLAERAANRLRAEEYQRTGNIPPRE